MNRADTLFDVTEAQVCAVLTDVIGVPVLSFTPQISAKPENGISGETRRVTFACTTDAGGTTEATLFVKRCTWKGRSEAIHYRYLTEKGVPTAHLYGAVSNNHGEEIIFLEPLTAIGFQQDSETEWRKMLSLLAQFNSCPISPDYALHLHPYEQVGHVGNGVWITGLQAQPTEEDLDAGWQACGIPSVARPALTRTAQGLFARVAAQPMGLLHQDFLTDNFGWRGDRTEMAVFDLHKNACGPRFADVVPYLSAPDWSDRADFLNSVGLDGTRRRDAFAQHYLNSYARFGGPDVTLETFRAETTDLFWAHKVAVLSWLAEQGHSGRVQAVLDFLHEMTP